MKMTGTESLEKPEAKHAEKKAPEKKSSAKKKHTTKNGKTLAGMHVKRNADHSFTMRHEYEDAHGVPDMKQPEYTAQSVDDLHDHMDQHFGGGDPAAAEPDADDQAPPAAGAPAPGAPGA